MVSSKYENTLGKKNSELFSIIDNAVLVGVMSSEQKVCFNTLPIHFGKVLTGSHGGDGNPSLDINRYIKVEKTSGINMSSILSKKKYSLNEINDAINSFNNGEDAGRIIIGMQD